MVSSDSDVELSAHGRGATYLIDAAGIGEFAFLQLERAIVQEKATVKSFYMDRATVGSQPDVGKRTVVHFKSGASIGRSEQFGKAITGKRQLIFGVGCP